MDEGAIYATLTEIFREMFRREAMVLTPELSAKDVEGWDSFRQVDIILLVEQRFGFTMNTKELDSLNNVGDLARVVVARTVAR